MVCQIPPGGAKPFLASGLVIQVYNTMPRY